VTQITKHWKFYYRTSCYGRGTQGFQVHFIFHTKFCNRHAGAILASLSVRPDKDNMKMERLDWEDLAIWGTSSILILRVFSF